MNAKVSVLLLAGIVAVTATCRALANDALIVRPVAILTATTNAPAGATGLATFIPMMWATPDDVVNPTTNPPLLHVTTEGLSTGTYTVVVTDTQTNSHTLGTFVVTTVTNPVPNDTGGRASTSLLRIVNIGGGAFTLTDGLNPSNVVGVSVSDANDLVDLIGTFPGPIFPPPCGLDKITALAATSNAPPVAAGFAELRDGPCFEPLETSAAIPTFEPTIHVMVHGLSSGTYSVSVTDVATNSYVLGTFDVPTITNQNADSVSLVVTDPPPPIIILVGTATFALPAGLDPATVVGISVSDSNDVVDLTGIFHAPPPPPREFHKFIVLADTTNAPPGAMGRAALEGEIDGDINTVMVKVETLGLLTGTYTTTITDTTGTNTYTLGTFDVHVWSNLLHETDASIAIFWTNTVGGASFSLPAGLDPANVTTITISDTNQLADLTGNFATAHRPHPCFFDAHIWLVPGPTCANLFGTGWLHVQCTGGNTQAHISLIASGAPPKATWNLFVNGVQTGTVKTDRRGRLIINKLPKGTDLLGVTTIAAEDDAGNVAFSASF
ncbi:MAG TPA: hypothetical protein VLZ30_04385 [Verrucomicrobiae bacterium]|nr:hypothetical protein [Verrucomicrobiae bacterium]